MRLLPIAAVLALMLPGLAHAQTPPAERDGAHDFDFLLGDWKAKLRKLEKPLSGQANWLEYEGISRTHKVLDTSANFEEFEVRGAKPDMHLKGQTLRLYNPETQSWSLNFANAADGTLTIPTVGKFKDGRGEFFNEDMLGDKPILVRFVITPMSPDSIRFEQAFSPDQGKTWEVNWIATDTRTRDAK